VLEETNSIDMGPSPITGQVSKSMTKSRMTGAGGVISLDFAGLPQHLHQVVHYITHYEAVRNFDKLRRKSEFSAMYHSYFGADGYKQLRSWLQNIATNGTIADLAIVWAKLDGVIRGFIVEKGDAGFSAPEMKGKHSLKASVTSELVFQDCRIPKDRLLPHVKGLKGPFSCLNNARFGISWGAIGAAMACFHSSKDYALNRIQFGKPIAGFQLIQNKLAWMLREITKAQLLSLHLVRMKDAGTMFPEQISLAKMNNVDIALEIARVSRDIHGANGILDEYPIMRHMANLESVKTYEGTHDVHNLIIGRWITGIQAFE
jgi:alkylation response protein AidB-like acyl-CoA dehydrogenase